MARPFRYMLVTDGPSDACLKYPIEWLLREYGWQQFEGEWADLRQLPESGRTLAKRLEVALRYYTAEILFVHRDAEAEPRANRIDEITQAVATLTTPPALCGDCPRADDGDLVASRSVRDQTSGGQAE
jgi:hypothetical protein